MQPEKEAYVIFMHVFISWVIFSILYLIAAYHKPFHVDEFYSWVYPERCSVKDILTLKKQYGIGHPPLYHVLQKLVQTVFQPYHHINVRLVNYFIGSLFILLFSVFTLKQKNIPYFCYGVAGSAAILEVFIFSRMWGLICLASLLLLWSGEEYCKSHKRSYLLLFIGSCVLGFISDYSFIVLSLYFVIVLFWRKKYLMDLVYLYLILLFIAFVFSTYRVVNTKGVSITHVLYSQISDLGLIILKTMNVVFNFWFVEPLLVALLIFGVFVMLEIFRRNNPQLINVTVPFNYVAAMVSSFKEKLRHIFDINHDYNRIFLTVIGAWLIILTVNPYFWTEIIRKRFLTILIPFLLLIIIRHCNKKTLRVLTIIFIFSGVLFVSSNRVAGVYPPPSFDDENPVIYQDEWAYATQYLRSHERPPKVPYVVDFSSFMKSCRVCKMGTNNIPFHKYNTLKVVWSNRSDPDEFIPPDFTRTNEGKPNFTWMDQLQFNYLTLLPKTKYLVYTYQKTPGIHE
jgi:hypothetical protein